MKKLLSSCPLPLLCLGWLLAGCSSATAQETPAPTIDKADNAWMLVSAALAAGFTLIEMHERIVDDAWIASKPKWEKYRDRPTSFAMVWRRDDDR